MIATYDETWKFLVRQFGYTARHPQFNPFYIIDSLHHFIQSADDTILDIGCGDFNLKWTYPHKNWVGVDKTSKTNKISKMSPKKNTQPINLMHLDE